MSIQRAVIFSLVQRYYSFVVAFVSTIVGTSRTDRSIERPIVLAGSRPVMGELRPAAGFCGTAGRGPRVERLGKGPMEPAPLAGQQFIVDGLLHQCVAEGIALGVVSRLDDQQMAGHRRAKPVGGLG